MGQYKQLIATQDGQLEVLSGSIEQYRLQASYPGYVFVLMECMIVLLLFLHKQTRMLVEQS